MTDTHRHTGVVGCGLIGASWAGLFMASGRDVFAWDPMDAARADFAGRVDTVMAQICETGLFPNTPPGTLHIVASIEEVAENATLIQENAPENTDLKRGLYAAIERAGRDDLIIASSTSSLVWSELSVEMKQPARLVTAHPFNPPHLMPLVELYGPDRSVLDDAEAFYRSLGRVPVRMKKQAVGHIANRLASALWREAVNIVAEDIAGVAEVDAALVNGPGLRWSVVGAHMAYHLGGGAGGIAHYLEHLGPSQERRWATLGSPRLTPGVCAKLTAGILDEAQGRSVADLEAERDRGLMAVLRALAVQGNLGQSGGIDKK
jgi:carnitine 3-dehydrogenase